MSLHWYLQNESTICHPFTPHVPALISTERVNHLSPIYPTCPCTDIYRTSQPFVTHLPHMSLHWYLQNDSTICHPFTPHVPALISTERVNHLSPIYPTCPCTDIYRTSQPFVTHLPHMSLHWYLQNDSTICHPFTPHVPALISTERVNHLSPIYPTCPCTDIYRTSQPFVTHLPHMSLHWYLQNESTICHPFTPHVPALISTERINHLSPIYPTCPCTDIYRTSQPFVTHLPHMSLHWYLQNESTICHPFTPHVPALISTERVNHLSPIYPTCPCTDIYRTNQPFVTHLPHMSLHWYLQNESTICHPFTPHVPALISTERVNHLSPIYPTCPCTDIYRTSQPFVSHLPHMSLHWYLQNESTICQPFTPHVPALISTERVNHLSGIYSTCPCTDIYRTSQPFVSHLLHMSLHWYLQNESTICHPFTPHISALISTERVNHLSPIYSTCLCTDIYTTSQPFVTHGRSLHPMVL